MVREDVFCGLYDSLMQGVMIVVVGLLTLYCGGIGVRWFRLSPALRSHYSKLPKGSLGWPVLGETLALRKSLLSSAPHSFVAERRQRHGKMFLTHLLGNPLIASTDADFNRLILHKEDQFVATLPKSIAMAVGKNALLFTRGDRHKRMRRLLLSVLTVETLKYHTPFIQELASSVLSGWRGRTVIVANETRDYSFHVVLRVVLGMSRGESDHFHSKFMEMRNGVRAFPILLPGTAYSKAVKARKDLEGIVAGFIKKRKERMEKHFPDLLHVLLHANETDGGGDLSNAEITDLILSTMLAGFDTTANALLFLVYYIGEHPQVLQDLKAEHDEILKNKEPEASLTWSDYKRMKLTQSTINETLRLANPVLSLHRRSVEDFEHDGYMIPAGCPVQVWIRTIHTDPNIFPEPYKFDITRWKGQATGNNFFPFGTGPRLCVGIELSRIQLCFFIHTLVTTYRWVLAETDTPKFFAEPGMKKGLPVIVTDL